MSLSALKLICLCWLVLPLTVGAQPLVDLRLSRDGNTVAVSLLPAGPFDGLVSNVQWTLSWTGPGPDPGNLTQAAGPATWLPVAASGPVVVAQGRYFQTFAGFGLQRLGALGQSWAAGTPVTILRLEAAMPLENVVLHPGPVPAVANGQAYVELDGLPRTGQVLEGGWPVYQAAATPGPALSLYPNPGDGHFFLDFTLDQPATGSLQLLDLMGRELWQQNWQKPAGAQQLAVTLPPLASGLYLLRFRSSTASSQTLRLWLE